MGYLLKDEGKELVQLAHDFCEKEILPCAAEWDREGTFPKEVLEKAMEIGFHTLEIPEEYGGSGMDYITVAAVYEEFGKYDLGFATTLMANTLSLKPVLMHGTEEQKQRYSETIVNGGFGAFALTEADAGSDAGATKTIAVKDGDEYIINGSKSYITNSTYADEFVVFAVTDKEKGLKGISAFIVEKDREGFSVGKEEDKMGIRSSDTATINFDDVRVPAENLLGEEGKGFIYAMQTLDLARPLVGATAVGLAQRSIDEAAKYSLERKAFGKPIAKLQAIGFKLADMEIGAETARQMVVHSLQLAEEGLPYTKEAAIAKCYAGDVAFKNASEAIQILGGYGYSREYPVEKLLRDAKILQIFEGTNEIQRVIISGQVINRAK
ncbi:acyl-CoA dehydrogenase family protein [uncultured Anaerococcus sp.]|uniref:acyl-CoA dehydrogenase family protein n=1 Tax=uncultured Anaerococcus sp. TaxID=293428 RepID=UPI00261DE443|nr:acyl-CoA dehydrogenase family protein [uncultured Anaerococcus sp.]